MVLLILRISGNRSRTSVSDFYFLLYPDRLRKKTDPFYLFFSEKIDKREATTMAITKVVMTQKMIQLFSLVNMDFLKVILF
jgi:hypothetical protein